MLSSKYGILFPHHKDVIKPNFATNDSQGGWAAWGELKNGTGSSLVNGKLCINQFCNWSTTYMKWNTKVYNGFKR